MRWPLMPLLLLLFPLAWLLSAIAGMLMVIGFLTMDLVGKIHDYGIDPILGDWQ